MFFASFRAFGYARTLNKQSSPEAAPLILQETGEFARVTKCYLYNSRLAGGR